jgi:hypothetical protein
MRIGATSKTERLLDFEASLVQTELDKISYHWIDSNKRDEVSLSSKFSFIHWDLRIQTLFSCGNERGTVRYAKNEMDANPPNPVRT